MLLGRDDHLEVAIGGGGDIVVPQPADIDAAPFAAIVAAQPISRVAAQRGHEIGDIVVGPAIAVAIVHLSQEQGEIGVVEVKPMLQAHRGEPCDRAQQFGQLTAVGRIAEHAVDRLRRHLLERVAMAVPRRAQLFPFLGADRHCPLPLWDEDRAVGGSRPVAFRTLS
ncbi:hypothetical protein ACFSTI_25735 [Rhizorhabdus histidinilytica]